MGSCAAIRPQARRAGSAPSSFLWREASSSSSLRGGAQQLVTLKSYEKRASAEPLFHLDADCRARQKGHWPRQFLEGAVAVGYAKSGDIVERAVLQFVPRTAVENRIAERDVLGAVEPLKDAADKREWQTISQRPVGAKRNAQKVLTDANAVQQGVRRKKSKWKFR